MNRKKSIVTLATIAIAAIMIISMFYMITPRANASTFTYTPSNVTVAGVLATDNYVYFPWPEKSLTIGFSKYGEMIDTNTLTGLNYAGLTDPFAPFGTNVPPFQWIEGWVLNITYKSPGGYANVWAFALHSNYYNPAGIGGNWIQGVKGGALNASNEGGRQTSGGAYTAPIQVLYNGPRSFLAVCNTTIYADTAHTLPLVMLTFTIEFDKVTKQVTLLKDVKRIDYGKSYGPMQIEFGDRGEWDLGPATSATGYIPYSSCNIFENLTSSYNYEYQSWYQNSTDSHFSEGTYDLAQIISMNNQFVGWAAFWPKPLAMWVQPTEGIDGISRQDILTSTTTHTEDYIANASQTNFPTLYKADPYPQSNMTGIFWLPDPMVFVNGAEYLTNGTASPPYNTCYFCAGNSTVIFPKLVIHKGDDVKLVYIVYKYDFAMPYEGSPFLIGEWAWLASTPGQIFRGVTVYGVAERNDGVNTISPSTDHLDSQIEYFADSIFQPYDLQTAVTKDDVRWVNFFSGDGSTTDFMLSWNYTTDGPIQEGPWLTPPSDLPYYQHAHWDEYANQYNDEAERVTVDGVLAAPTYSSATYFNNAFTWNYTMTLDSQHHMWINFTSPPPTGTNNVEVKYTTDSPHYIAFYGADNSENVQELRGQFEWTVVGSKAATVDSLGASYVTEAFDSIKHIDVLKAGLDFRDTSYGPNVPWVSGYLGTGSPTNNRTAYYDCIGRSYLADNWCLTEPISSSEMIFVGGPRANLGEEYFNSFTSAFYPENQYVVNNTLGQANKILCESCWHLNSYTDNSTMGYGVISVSEDMNGTVGLVFWGLGGQDTYYVTQWFWNYPYGIQLLKGMYPTSGSDKIPGGIVYSGIQYLQHEDCGVTSIVLQINYATHTDTIGGITYHFDASNPEITIAHNERLGTISEKGQHDP